MPMNVSCYMCIQKSIMLLITAVNMYMYMLTLVCIGTSAQIHIGTCTYIHRVLVYLSS